MKTLIKEINIINEGTILFPILSNGSGWKSSEKDKLSVIESGEGKEFYLYEKKPQSEYQKLMRLNSKGIFNHFSNINS